MSSPQIPQAPKSIQKGVPLKNLLGQEAAECLANNILLVYKDFDAKSFCQWALDDIELLSIMQRGKQFAKVLHQHLPDNYQAAIDIILASLTEPLSKTEDNGLAVFFYLPHNTFVAMYGLNPNFNQGKDPFEISMKAQYELTKRFSSEFSIRPFLIHEQQRTLTRLLEWTLDTDPHVRRLCSEGTRPRLPWAVKIPSFIDDPSQTLTILETLKDDSCLYVRRSVANHLGDIAKDHLSLVLDTCQQWLVDSSNDRRWLIRHALRHPAKKGDNNAIKLRVEAKALK
jgi:3-methyladenine DNA glycosylase AlkC